MVDRLIGAVLRGMAASSRGRAAKAGIEYSLPDGYASLLYEHQNGRCDVTDLPFSMQRFPEAFVKHPFAPSLDRRDSRGGYTVDNVRLVFVSVNFGMGQWGQEAYLYGARAAVERDAHLSERVKAIPDWHALQRDRIGAAEAIAEELTGNDLLRQRRRIGSLKRILALGPDGLALAARRAAVARAARG
jgi:hypothetical protein